MTAPEAKAELIRTLDEKFVANSIAFDAMIAAAALLVDGAPLRTADGAIDLAGIRARFEAVSWHVPAMRQRLAPTPLRLTTPAWVPVADLDIARHVTLHPTIEPDDPDRVELLTGRLNGPMDPARPLWDMRIVELDSGRVAIVARYHHVIGDALFGLRIGEVVAGTEPSPDLPVVTDAEREALGVAPRTGVGILAIAFRAWRTQRHGFRDAWHEYWRKPFTRRLRPFCPFCPLPLLFGFVLRVLIALTLGHPALHAPSRRCRSLSQRDSSAEEGECLESSSVAPVGGIGSLDVAELGAHQRAAEHRCRGANGASTLNAGIGYVVAFVVLTLGLTLALSLGADAMGTRIRQSDASSQLLLVPQLLLVLLSSGMAPVESFPGWVQGFVRYQPVSQVTQTLRAFTEGHVASANLAISVLWCVGLIAAFGYVALRMQRHVR